MLKNQPWIHSPAADLSLVIGPPLLVSALVVFSHRALAVFEELPPWAWLGLVLCVDVAHVYGTLFRTYLNARRRREQMRLLVAIPLLAWLSGIALYSMGELDFWRVLAYLAVFHFIRQQYGFMRIYSRKSAESRWNRRLDAAPVYSGALYPLLYWHTHLPRRFDWFVPGDFFQLPSVFVPWVSAIDRCGFAIFLAIQALFIAREARRFLSPLHRINMPKDLIVLGTAVSWYTGIVVYNADMTFTLTNVVSHGIPYLALVWFTSRKKILHGDPQRLSKLLISVVGFVALVLAFAYLEESFWDALIWRDHPQFFSWSYWIPLIERPGVLRFVIPLLVLPQFTHYILDGFIWKVRDPALLGETI